MAQRSRSTVAPFMRFWQVEAAGGCVLLAAAALALAWSNSSAAGSYRAIWQVPLNLGVGPYRFAEPLRFWVNDALMTLFFLLVGLEIRRELREGALADIKLAALPVIAALAGVLVPALIYSLFNANTPLWRGWAVPTATDIAFAIGALALLGKRVPPGLRVLLLAIAIIDDIVAILIIALFYSHGIGWLGLLIAGTATALFATLFRTGLPPAVLAITLGLVIWWGLLSAGVHPALSGVVVGLLIPIPAGRQIERAIHPWVAFGIMPLFALANAGVNPGEVSFGSETTSHLIAGITAGLVIGKPIGIVLATALAVRLGWCALPRGVDIKRVGVIGCLGGIGFTMSIFISHLAFEDEPSLAAAKVAILLGSGVAAMLGLLAGYRWL